MDERLRERRINVMKYEFRKMIETHGWAAHFVVQDAEHINYHTHGVLENYGVPDFQIVLPMQQQTAHDITRGLIEAIKQGTRFEFGVEYAGYLGNGFKLRLEPFQEGGRQVARILFPDRQGRMPDNPECDAYFKKQIDKLED